MSEYATVLHLHKLNPSRIFGPMYVYPGSRGGMVEAAKDTSQEVSFINDGKHYHSQPPLHVDIMYAATVHGF